MGMGRIAMVVAACALCVGMAQAQDTSSREPDARRQLMALHWVDGPAQVDIGSNATFRVPDGYRFLGPADTVKFMELTRNLPPSEGATIFAPGDFRWWGMFEYDDAGHVPDDEKIDSDALLSTLRSNQVRANKELTARGWATLDVVGWAKAPFYDPVTHDLSWAVDLRDSGGNDNVNFDTRLLGRTGYTAATLITDSEGLQASIDEFKQVVAGYEYVADQNYAAYRPGDKVAKYGLAALITGGAAAVAAKTGLWKVIVGALAAGWKFVAAAVIALFVGIGKFLKRITGRGNSG